MAIPLPNADETITLQRIFELSPKAKSLWNEALGYGMADPLGNNEERFFREHKKRLLDLIGFHALEGTPIELCSADAYDTFHAAILSALNCYSVHLGLLAEAKQRKYKPGWAAHQFKLKFGVYPRFQIRRKFQAVGNR